MGDTAFFIDHTTFLRTKTWSDLTTTNIKQVISHVLIHVNPSAFRYRIVKVLKPSHKNLKKK